MDDREDDAENAALYVDIVGGDAVDSSFLRTRAERGRSVFDDAAVNDRVAVCEDTGCVESDARKRVFLASADGAGRGVGRGGVSILGVGVT